MPRKADRSKSDDTKKDAPRYRGYIRAEFLATDKPHVRDWLGQKSDTDILDLLAEVLDGGYRLTAVDNGKGVNASLFNLSGPETLRGYMLGAFGANVRLAVGALLYKHFVLLKDGWQTVAEEDDEEDAIG